MGNINVYKMLATLISLVFLFSSTLASAIQVPENCFGSSSHFLKLPGDTQIYFESYGGKADGPTVILLNGGPSSIGKNGMYFHKYLGLTEEINLVILEYSGFGCAPAPRSSMKSLAQMSKYSALGFAGEAADLIKALNLKKDRYSVIGISYGGLVALTLGSKISEFGIPSPKAIILNATPGTADPKGACDQACRKNKVFERVFARLPREAQDFFGSPPSIAKGTMGNYLGVRGSSWLNYFSNLIWQSPNAVQRILTNIYLANAKGDVSAQEALSSLVRMLAQSSGSNGSLNSSESQLKGTTTASAQTETLPEQSLKGWILNRELNWGSYQDPAFDSIVAPKSPFDAALFNSEAPLVFVSGEDDPIAPVEWAKDAFDRNPSPEKYFFVYPHGGHTWILDGAEAPCTNRFWRELFSSGPNISGAVSTLNSCPQSP